jgi:hypothetical protein
MDISVIIVKTYLLAVKKSNSEGPGQRYVTLLERKPAEIAGHAGPIPLGL